MVAKSDQSKIKIIERSKGIFNLNFIQNLKSN